MKEYPILMNTEMVKAILEKRKTQTRRVIEPQPPKTILNPTLLAKDAAASSGYSFISDEYGEILLKCCYGQPGDRLWVRETWQLEMNSGFYDIRYKADNYLWDCGTLYQKLKSRKCWVWRPSIHMPRWASRINLENANVRVEKLQEITGEDCIKEGIDEKLRKDYGLRYAFGCGWNSLYAKKPEYQWEANPWVWVIHFYNI